MMSDEILVFAEEDSESPVNQKSSWQLLVVDDEHEVHEATRLALSDVLIMGRSVQITSAFSSREAKKKLSESKEYACILLDVVMETDSAGLDLVGHIRDTLGLYSLRIVLRTGQPGYAPELSVISKYDINDYKNKNELSRTRLVTTLTTAFRSYQQIKTIDESKKGLALIVESAPSLFMEHSAINFAKGLLFQLSTLLNIEHHNGFVCCRENRNEGVIKVLAASDGFEKYIGKSLDNIENDVIKNDILLSISNKEDLIKDGYAVFYMETPGHDSLVVRVETDRPLCSHDIDLIKLFSVNVVVGFVNTKLVCALEDAAFVDALTGLPNYVSLIRQLECKINKHEFFSLLLIDIDNFQYVNDGLGRDIGDELLFKVLDIIKEVFGIDNLVYRISADVFVVVIADYSVDSVALFYKKFQLKLREGVNIRDFSINVSCSAGIVSFPEHGVCGDVLVQNASIAMKHCKNTIRGDLNVFSLNHERLLKKRLQMVSELRYAIERKELEVFFQPQISLSDNKVIGMEALVRWRRNDEFVSPVEFIPAAEASGLIIPIGFWILKEACIKQVLWCHQTGKDIGVSVNISMRQLIDIDFISGLSEVLEESGINPNSLELEITESVMMENYDLVSEKNKEIRSMGVRISIDDFGTGYSSLSYLQSLVVDQLKIDRSFIKGLGERPEDHVIVSMIIQMGHFLRLEVIAEGVETEVQLKKLKELGCDQVQGYYFAKPMPYDLIVNYILAYD